LVAELDDVLLVRVSETLESYMHRQYIVAGSCE
jgi:hypothetical protein